MICYKIRFHGCKMKVWAACPYCNRDVSVNYHDDRKKMTFKDHQRPGDGRSCPGGGRLLSDFE